jgi:hypothetical protein
MVNSAKNRTRRRKTRLGRSVVSEDIAAAAAYLVADAHATKEQTI